MSQKHYRPWIKAEQKRGFRAARGVLLGSTLSVLCGIIQAGAAARLLAQILHIEKAGLSSWVTGLVFVLAVLARAMLQLRCEHKQFTLGVTARQRLRRGVVAALFAMGPGGLRGRHSAELAAMVVDRVEAMEGFHARWIPAAGLAITGPALVGLVALLVDWRSGLVLMIAGLLVPFAMALAGIGAGRAAKKQFLSMTRLQVRFLDRIRGISTIVLAGRAEDEAQALGRAASDLRQRTMRVLRVAFLSSTALDLAAAAALVLIVIRFTPVLHGAHELAGTALFMVLLVPEFFAPLRGFSAVYGDRMAVEAVAEGLAALPQVESLPAVRNLSLHNSDPKGVTLAFEHVSYGWDRNRPVLENLSFQVGRGEMLLLSGASGAGKSTIIDLILGFLEPQAGEITFNGVDLRGMADHERTRMLGWIGQKPVVFAGTIEENIRFACPEASDEELRNAIRLAHLETMIAALPQGLQTPLGAGGFGVSGGQAQRIAIARAFLKDAPLLLLDEPTSHLDPAVERDILASLQELSVGRAVVLATHSVQAIELAKARGAKRVDLDALRYTSWRGGVA